MCRFFPTKSLSIGPILSLKHGSHFYNLALKSQMLPIFAFVYFFIFLFLEKGSNFCVNYLYKYIAASSAHPCPIQIPHLPGITYTKYKNRGNKSTFQETPPPNHISTTSTTIAIFISPKVIWHARGMSRMSLILILSYRLKEVTNSNVLHCFVIQRFAHISGIRIRIVTGFSIKM